MTPPCVVKKILIGNSSYKIQSSHQIYFPLKGLPYSVLISKIISEYGKKYS